MPTRGIRYVARHRFALALTCILMLQAAPSGITGNLGPLDLALFILMTGDGRGDPEDPVVLWDDIIIEAIKQGNPDQVKRVLDKGNGPNARHKMGGSALRWAAICGHKEIAVQLLDHGANVNMIKGGEPEEELIRSAIRGNAGKSQELLQKRADVNAKAEADDTPLHWACILGHTQLARLFLDMGADVNATNRVNCTPLSVAALNGHEETVKLLLDRGADPRMGGYPSDPKLLASLRGHANIVRLLEGYAPVTRVQEKVTGKLRISEQPEPTGIAADEKESESASPVSDNGLMQPRMRLATNDDISKKGSPGSRTINRASTLAASKPTDVNPQQSAGPELVRTQKQTVPENQKPKAKQEMYRANPQRTGFYETEGLKRPAGLKWKIRVGHVQRSPLVVSHGLVFFFPVNGNLIAVDARNGRERWKFPDSWQNAITVADGLLFFRDGRPLYAVDIKTRQRKWKQDFWTDGRIFVTDRMLITETADGFLCGLDVETGQVKWTFVRGHRLFSPTVGDGMAFVTASENYFLAVDADTGKEMWEYRPVGCTLNAHISVSEGILYFEASEGDSSSCRALDVKAKREKWKAPCELICSRPTAVNGTCLFPSSDNLYALDCHTGREKWKLATNGLLSTPVVADGTVYFRESGALKAVDLETGTVKWDWELGRPVRNSSSGATVADGIVYFGTNDGYLCAVDVKAAEKGYSEHWALGSTGGAVSSPVVADSKVYWGCADGYLRALSAVRPLELWRFKTGAGIRSSPTVTNGTVYVGSDDHHLYAIETETGVEKWKFNTQGDVVSSPAVWESTLSFGSMDGYLYALDSNTGAMKWKLGTEGGIQSSPAICNNVVYVGNSAGWLHAADLESGSPKWSFNAQSGVQAAPAVDQGFVFLGSTGGNFFALEAETGSEKWKFKTGGAVQCSAAVAGQRVLMGSKDGNLYALDSATGTEMWRFTAEGPIDSSPTVADGMVYFGCDDGHLYVLDINTGRLKLKFKAGAAVRSSPAISNGAVYFTSSDGRLHMLR